MNAARAPLRLARAPARLAPLSLFAKPRMASTKRTTEPDEPLEPLVLPFKAKKVWPPDFTRLTAQQQLRFEKRYKRRVALLSDRPRWNKMVKLVQLCSITFVVVYGLLFLEWDNGPAPFEGLRTAFWHGVTAVTGIQRPARTLPKPSTPQDVHSVQQIEGR